VVKGTKENETKGAGRQSHGPDELSYSEGDNGGESDADSYQARNARQALSAKSKHDEADDDGDDHGGGGGGGGHESDEFLWLYSFNDMLFNLLLFFIVMFAISSINKSRFEAVAEALNYPKDKREQEKTQPLLFKRDNVEVSLNDLKSNDVYVECSNPILPPKDTNPGEDGGQVKGSFQREVTAKEDEQFKTRAIVLSGNEYFRPGQSEPTAEGLRFVKKLAARYKGSRSLVQVQVEGYGYEDEVAKSPGSMQESASDRRAWALSAQRAASMLNLMVEEGFDPQISSISGFGPGSRELLGYAPDVKSKQSDLMVTKEDGKVAGGKVEPLTGTEVAALQMRPKVIIRMTESIRQQSTKATQPKRNPGKSNDDARRP
jgi:chemotaxis protein MotB